MTRMPFRGVVLLLLVLLTLLAGCASKEKVRIFQVNEKPDYYARIKKCGSVLLPLMDPENIEKHKVSVIQSEIPNAYISDYVIVINSYILDNFPQNELCSIMAHEISHQVLGHYSKRKTAAYVTTGVMLVVNSMIPGAGYLNHIVNPLTVNYFSREQESEADRKAVDALIQTGQDPEAYVRALERLRQWAIANKVEQGGGLLDSHPALGIRIEETKQYIRSKSKVQ
jgi:Zn-dependent protease with chaperone function